MAIKEYDALLVSCNCEAQKRMLLRQNNLCFFLLCCVGST